MVGELALSLVLLVAAGHLFHAFINLRQVDPGFDTERIVSVQLRLTSGYEGEQITQFTDRLMNRLEAIPGVNRAGAGLGIPFQFTGNSRCCWQRDLASPATPDQGVRATLHPVTEGYFDALQAEIVFGREFQPGDEQLVPVPAVISAPAAEALFGDPNPVGELLTMGDGPTDQIVVIGVLGSLRHWAFSASRRSKCIYRTAGSAD